MTQLKYHQDEHDRSRKLHDVCDDAGWLKKVLTWNWHDLSLDGYPGWELEGEAPRRHPPFVKLTIVKGRDKSSADISREWDDLATGLFYCRDWTGDGVPFVNDGEPYWAGFWFQTADDVHRFVERYVTPAATEAAATPRPA